MPFARIDDNGMTVTVDLHGTTVHEAVDIVYRVLDEAAARGRSSVKVIHGSSTSNADPSARTIKNTLHDELDRGGFADVTGVLRQPNHLMLSLDITAPNDPRPIRAYEVAP